MTGENKDEFYAEIGGYHKKGLLGSSSFMSVKSPKTQTVAGKLSLKWQKAFEMMFAGNCGDCFFVLIV